MCQSNLNIQIQVIHEDSPYLKAVNELADGNIKTLSFQHYSFFNRYAKQPGIIIALADRNFVGYLIWSINSRNSYARVWQLCIKPEYRGQKIPKLLNNKLIELTQNRVRGIRLECKDNYGIDRMWRQLGYVPLDDKKAKTPGDILKIWSIEYLHPAYPSIFSPEAISDTLKFRSAIDAKTLYNLILESHSIRKQSLSIEWLMRELGVCITDEIFNEIDREYNSSDKTLLRRIVNSQLFKQVHDLNLFESTLGEIENLLNKASITLDETLIRHLAKCAASDIPYFITSKDTLLARSEFCYVNFGIRVISLEDMVKLRDEIVGQLNYQPLRLANHSIKKQSLELCDLSQLAQKMCRSPLGEKTGKLIKNLRFYANQPKRFIGYILIYEDQPYICVVYDVSRTHVIEVPILRNLSNLTISDTLINYSVHDLLKITISRQNNFLCITDSFLGKSEEITLKAQYFVKNPNRFEWIKCCHQNSLSAENTTIFLRNVTKEVPEYYSISHILISLLNSDEFLEDPFRTMDIERLMWPLKIEDSNIPSFIVPIKPEAAKELFEEKLARETLFGVNKPSLFLSVESVYYKSPYSHAGLNKAPARILWYVSQSKDGGYSNLSTIRACSQVDDVIVNSPEELHKRFQHLGFYNLNQIKKCANQKGQVMAIKFSHTELFDFPIDLKTIQQCLESRAPLQSIRKISQSEFIKLYRLGLNLK
jgi:Acetyltransferase (GNAT) family